MIQPGRETNLPNSADVMMTNQSVYGMQLFKADGFTLTLGMVLVIIVTLLIYQTFFQRKRR